ncbi:segregation/condensation protein A [Roseomonas sp. OT10]|uniref:segregation and condensation protein A n=1 Tax=Roseomonas cutis TaxID=2897332 RepID=UPI001E5C145E|nr:ScpA family protein [Roseomonas sp. OT10]UFN50733.1 segregation/condensation protein A [Roseomonas sp. OT10]
MSGQGTPAPVALHLRLEGFEGPLDLLLELARSQKVDLSRLDIVALVDQYLAVVEGARRVRLELAADWLVMAAWLAWLKSRLLLPEPEPDADAEAAAGSLADRLRALELLRAGAAWLGERPVLGRDTFSRGLPESLTQQRDGALSADLPALLHAWSQALRRAAARRPYVPKARKLWTVQDALGRLRRLLGTVPGWGELSRFLPEELSPDPVERRAALASTLIAGLELARGGGVELRQEEPFGPILLRPGEGPEPGGEALHDAA